MSKKKILAGLLSLTMAASFAPMSVLADENTGRSFTNAWGDVINQNECLYYEDFEGDTGSDFDIDPTIAAKGYWHSAVTEKDGNKAMRYYATPNEKLIGDDGNPILDEEGNEQTIPYNGTDGKNLINKKVILPTTTEINNKNWYEIGYTYYPDDMRAYMTDIFGVYMNNSRVSRLASHGWNLPYWLRHHVAYYPDGFLFRDGWNAANPVHVKVVLDASTGDIMCHYKRGAEQGKNKTTYGKTGNNTSIVIGNSSNINIKISCDSDPVANAKKYNNGVAAEEPGYRIDNFYVKKIMGETPVVTFVNNGEEQLVNANYFDEVTIPARPERDGYIFIGWFDEAGTRVDGTDENPVTILKDVKENMTITARWVQQSVVTFDSNGGSAVEPIETETGSITLPERPVKEGYSFMGWYYDNGTFTQPFDGTYVAESLTVYARWEEYLVKEDFENYTSGLFDIDPAITAKGYWHSNVVDDGTGNNKYMKYYMTPSDEVKFDAADGVKLINREILASTKAINKNGWYEIGYTYYPNGMKANMSNIFGVYMSDLKTVVSAIGVHRDTQPDWLGDTAKYYNDIITRNLWTIEGPIYIKTIYTAADDQERTYFTFIENGVSKTVVSLDGAMKAPRTKVANSSNIGLKIKCETDPTLLTGGNVEQGFMIDDFYVKELNTTTPTVTFINGADVTTANANYFNEVTLPEPTKENFRFVGWFTENDEAFTGKNITSNITVYAKWSGKYNVTFNANGGKFTGDSETKSIDVDSETPAAIDEEPTRDGYKFCGWFTDSSCVTEFNGTVYENTTVYARWQTTPTIESVTPENGSSGIELKPEVILTFDSEIDDTTLTKDNIKVLKDGTDLSVSLYNITSSLNAQRKTVVKITFTTELEASKEYTVKVLKAVKNQYSELTDDYTSSFTTKSLKLNVEKISVKSGDTEVTDLSTVKGQKIKVTLKLTNAAGVGYTTIYSFRNGNALVSAHSPENTVTGETVESELTVPENAQSLDLIVLDGLSTLKPLTGKTSIIE